MSAAVTGHTNVVKVLLDKGADVNVKGNRGETALMFSAGKGHTDTVKALLDKELNGSINDLAMPAFHEIRIFDLGGNVLGSLQRFHHHLH